MYGIYICLHASFSYHKNQPFMQVNTYCTSRMDPSWGWNHQPFFVCEVNCNLLVFPHFRKLGYLLHFRSPLGTGAFPTRKHGPDDSSPGNQVHQNRLSKDQRPPHLCANNVFKYALSSKLDGVFKYVLFSPLPGEIIRFEGYILEMGRSHQQKLQLAFPSSHVVGGL